MGISKKNIKPFIGSLVVALVLWILVATDKNYDYQISVPIELLRLAAHHTLSEPFPDQALIEVRGKGRSLLVSRFYDLKITLDFPELKSSTTVQLDEYLGTIDIPGALSIEILGVIEPKSFDLKVDELVDSKKPIDVSGSIGVEDGYTLIGYKCSPDSVQISGPKSLIGQIDQIYTEMVSMKGQRISFSENLTLENPNPALMQLEADNALVEFNIQRLVERVIYEIPIQVVNIPRNLTVESVPPKMALRIKGGENLVAQIQADEIKAAINFTKQYKVDQEEYGAEIITPENINWIESIPKKFRLKIRRR